MSQEEGYQGWKNYPTWCVNMWLTNEETLYEEATERVREILAETESRSEYWTLEESHRYAVAEMFKDCVCDDLSPDLGSLESGMTISDLIGYALDQVDWQEIADSWIDAVRKDL